MLVPQHWRLHLVPRARRGGGRLSHPSRGAVRLLRCRSRARRLRGAPLRRRRHRPGDLQAGAQAILAQADELARAAGLPPTAPLVLLGHSRGAKTCALAAALSSSNAAAAASGSSGSRGAWPRSCSSTRWTRPGPTRRQRSPQVEARAGVARTQAESRAEASLVWRESRMY